MSAAVSDSRKDEIRSLLSYSSLGLEMGLCVAIGLGMGYFLDKYFGTNPYLTILFMLFGVAAAFKALYVLWKKIERENERDQHS
jgi:ATP synthase protein I